MTEPSWSEGYVVDLDYTRGYFRDLSPALLRFATLLGGVEAHDAAPYTYYELGCGNGYSTALHAATDPRGRFVGVDFNPTHILNAQKLACDGGVDNVRFLEKSFAELLEMELEDADFIALHGVWSWVGPAQRTQLLEFIRRRLKPGGIVYLSYNALPGVAQIAPLQRLLNEHAAAGKGELADRIRGSMDFAGRLQSGGARFFTQNGTAASRLADMQKEDPHYLAHEYYNENWAPFFHVDVARALAEAKLAYAASAGLIDNFDPFVLNPETAKVAAEISDRSLAETVKDFARNRMFRRDVFTRGAPRAAAPRLDALLASARFALARPRSVCRLKNRTPAGEVTLQPETYAPVLDALARAPMTFDELSRSPECASLDRIRLRQAVFGLAATGNVLPALAADGEDARHAATARFNQAAIRLPAAGKHDLVLASPVLGAGVAITLADRLLLGAPRDEAQAAAKALEFFTQNRIAPSKDGKPIESAAEIERFIRERAKFFFADLLPFLRQLRVVD